MIKVSAFKEYQHAYTNFENAKKAGNSNNIENPQQKSILKPYDFSPFLSVKENHLQYYKNVLNINFGNSLDAQQVQLGASYDKNAKTVDFAVASKHATKIDLYIFDKPVKGKVIQKIEMQNCGGKWTTSIDKQTQKELNINIEGKDPIYYGFRAWGPNWEYDKDWQPGSDKGFKSHVDKDGNRFNPNKLLTDPYAKEISHDPMSPDKQGINYLDYSIYATGKEHYLKDSAPLGSKSIFVYQNPIDTGIKPRRAIKDDVIYEVHLKGFTMLDDKIPGPYKGTYKGAAMKAKYLKDMGVTMVEFLPVQEFQNDNNDLAVKLGQGQNYWGYDTNSFFAPDRKYSYDKSPGGPTKEFKEMVKAFHDQNIKVCLDVVYNHTGEGALWNKYPNTTKLYSMRGLDNQSYYELADDPKKFIDNTGCGANLNIANPIAKKLVIDSVKYWAEEMGVDAFRHDLAAVLGNGKERNGYSFDVSDSNNYLQRIKEEVDIRSEDGKKGSVDLIAEPWGGYGNGTYQAGNFPKGWMEWCDKYRDALRSTFNRQKNTTLENYTSAVLGTPHLYKGNTTSAINFITCHDGFTLKDLFSYNNKENNKKGFESDGGAEENISWDNFADPIRQRKAVRNSILTLMTSKGTPMILGGDEMMRTQYGNNNPYNQDKPLNYLNWDLNESQKMMQNFTREVIKFRNRHNALRDNKFYDGKDHNNNGLKDVTWLKADGKEPENSYYDNPENNFIAHRIDGTEYNDSASSIYTALNKGDSDISISLPENLPGKHWYFVADTSEHSEKYQNFVQEGTGNPVGLSHNISPRSMMIFVEAA